MKRKVLSPNQLAYAQRLCAEGLFNRADGRCICSKCLQPYYDHPQVEPTFYLLCNGKVVKT